LYFVVSFFFQTVGLRSGHCVANHFFNDAGLE
jgi:hypothetical protein